MRWLVLGSFVLSVASVLMSIYMDAFTFAITMLPLGCAWLLLVPWSMLIFANYRSARRWLAAFFCLLTPALVATATVLSIIWLGIFRDTAHFNMLRASYDREIALLPHTGHRAAEFNWGGMLYASRGVVYDETDEIMKPDGARSKAWLARWQNTDLMCGQNATVSHARPMGDHYYVTGFGC